MKKSYVTMSVSEYFRTGIFAEKVSEKTGKTSVRIVSMRECVPGWNSKAKAIKAAAAKVGISAGNQWEKGAVSNTRIKKQLAALCADVGLTANIEGQPMQFVNADVSFILGRIVKTGRLGTMSITKSENTILNAFLVAIHVRYCKGDYSEVIMDAVEAE